MAAKRRATSDLNYDQQDEEEDEVEEAGSYQRASEDALKRRVIKTARRRNPISASRGSEGENKNIFSGVTFSNTTPSTSNAFSFLSDLTTQPKVNGVSESTKESMPSIQENSTPTVGTNTVSFGHTNSIFTTNATDTTKSIDKKSDDYYSKLKGLNESVSKWIKKHVDANPLLNLQPIFKDYERYFKELELEKDSLAAAADANKPKVDNSNAKSSPLMSSFVFKASQNVPDSTTEKTTTVSQENCTDKPIPKFSFGSSQASTVSLNSTPSFSFGNTSTSGSFSLGKPNASTPAPASISSSFSFGSGKPPTLPTFNSSTPFTFSNVSKPPAATEEAKKEDDDYEPPKNDFTPVTENDYIYTIRCKVFVKKDEKFGDRGVGNLYLKPIENSDKVQLIVRADTSLGNLLCNFILSESIPTKRMGTKDVMLVCLPTPDFKPPPVPILLRVKTAQEADALLEVLNKHKK